MSPSPASSGSSGSSSLFYGVFPAEEVDGLGERNEEIPQQLMYYTLLEALFNMSLRSACFSDEAFFSRKSKIFALGTTLFMCQTVRIARLSDLGLKNFASYSEPDELTHVTKQYS